jgi:hypothetical protein
MATVDSPVAISGRKMSVLGRVWRKGWHMSPRFPGSSRRFCHRAVALPRGGAVGTLALAGRGGGGQKTGSSPRPTPGSPDPASFSGMPRSAPASSAASAIASARAPASAAASSAAPRALGSEASVGAEAARAGTAAESALENVQGRGHAVYESLPRNRTGGPPAALVTIPNKTSQRASYAVQAANLEPGHKLPIAFSGQRQGAHLTARLAKAQRYRCV